MYAWVQDALNIAISAQKLLLPTLIWLIDAAVSNADIKQDTVLTNYNIKPIRIGNNFIYQSSIYQRKS